MEKGISISRFKLYIAQIFGTLKYKSNPELIELKKTKKNLSSIITTNYDCMLEDIFGFKPLVGNDILLSNPYGALYKIHGSIDEPDKIIITHDDEIANQVDRVVRIMDGKIVSDSVNQ